MTPFKDLLALAVNRKGSLKAVKAELPGVADAGLLRNRDDAFYFSALTRRIFRAGLKHSLVDNKWPAFEDAFFGFDPEKLVLMPDSMLDERMQDTRLIRHWGKMKAIRHNAQLVLDLAEEYGSVGMSGSRRVAGPRPISVKCWLLRSADVQGRRCRVGLDGFTQINDNDSPFHIELDSFHGCCSHPGAPRRCSDLDLLP